MNCFNALSQRRQLILRICCWHSFNLLVFCMLCYDVTCSVRLLSHCYVLYVHMFSLRFAGMDMSPIRVSNPHFVHSHFHKICKGKWDYHIAICVEQV